MTCHRRVHRAKKATTAKRRRVSGGSGGGADGDPREALALLKEIRFIVGNLFKATGPDGDFNFQNVRRRQLEYIKQEREMLSKVLSKLTAHSRSYAMLEQFMNQKYLDANSAAGEPLVLFDENVTWHDLDRYQCWHALWLTAVAYAESRVPVAVKEITDRKRETVLVMNRKTNGAATVLASHVNDFVHPAPPQAVVAITDHEKSWFWYPTNKLRHRPRYAHNGDP